MTVRGEKRETVSNEAANSVRDFLETHHYKPLRNGKTWASLLDEALRTERRMVVEEIRERIGPMGPSYDEPWNRIDTILDEIGSAR